MKRLPERLPFRGETQCDLVPCRQWAQYTSQGQLLCGLHSIYDWERERLPPAPWERAWPLHERWMGAGKVTYRCIDRKTKPILPEHGVHHVFLQPRIAASAAGHHYLALSPWNLGPVTHRAPSLPAVDRLETYWRFGQAWPSELGLDGQLRDVFYQRRADAYAKQGLALRKFPQKEQRDQHDAVGAVNRSEALFFVHPDVKGVERFYTHIESRYFFCCAFEALASQREEFWRLKQWRLEGSHIVIFGLQERPNEDEPLWQWFESTQREFGAELALLAMLTTLEPAQYPWHQYRRRNEDRFVDSAEMLTEYHAVPDALYS